MKETKFLKALIYMRQADLFLRRTFAMRQGRSEAEGCNPWRTLGLNHNLSPAKVLTFTHSSAGESIPRLTAKVG
ncbi:MAG: hypothetical protein HC849_31340 [Oscillatoriales cyanobacterium RU_3_3]|nr:hypothetical protein [Oscillatoriales cyanobacterium RU_3_3]